MAKKEFILEDLPGVGGKIADKLREVGLTDPMAIAVASPTEMAAIADIGEAQAAKIINFVRESLDIGFLTADKILERKLSAVKNPISKLSLTKLIIFAAWASPMSAIAAISVGEATAIAIGSVRPTSLNLSAIFPPTPGKSSRINSFLAIRPHSLY